MTYTEYEAAVVKDIIRQTGWTEARARGMTADLSDFLARGISPTDAASELLAHRVILLGEKHGVAQSDLTFEQFRDMFD